MHNNYVYTHTCTFKFCSLGFILAKVNSSILPCGEGVLLQAIKSTSIPYNGTVILDKGKFFLQRILEKKTIPRS